jgi:putative membrane protein
MSPAFAFLHHVAAFALVAALAVEFVLLRDELNLKSARRLLAADAIYGASAGLVLVIGTLRVLYFEKGGAYYIHSVPFIAKIALFVCIGLLSITPTREFLSWRKSLREGRVPQLDAGKLRKLRSIIHLELAGIVLLILCAALMARGVGYFG